MATTRDQIALPPQARSVTVARRFARTVLHGWGLDELVDDAQLAVCELVANAVRHTVRDLALVMVLGDELLVEVHDADGRADLVANRPPDDSTTGRGLQIVEAVSSDWGVRSHEHGKAVWFSLTLPTSGRRDADLLEFDRGRGEQHRSESETRQAFGGTQVRAAR